MHRRRETPPVPGRAPPVFWAALDHAATFWIVLMIGMFLRVATLAFVCRMPLRGDALSYKQMGEALLRGDSFVPYWPPGLPYYLAAVMRCFGDDDLVVRASLILVYVALTFVLFVVVRRLTSRPVANLVVAVFAVYPTFVYHSVVSMTELPSAALLALAALGAVHARSSRWLSAAVMGLSIGALTLVRPASGILLPVVTAWAWGESRRWQPALLGLLLGAGLIGAWVCKTHAMTGRYIKVNVANARNLYFGNNAYTPLYRTWWFGSHPPGDPGVPEGYVRQAAVIEQAAPVDRDHLYTRAAWMHIVERPDLFVVRTLNRFQVFFVTDSYTAQVLMKAHGVRWIAGGAILIADGLVFTAIVTLSVLALFCCQDMEQYRRAVFVGLGCTLLYAVPYMLTFSHPRFHTPVMPLLACLGALVLERVRRDEFRARWHLAWARPSRRAGMVVVAVMFLAIQAAWLVMLTRT